MNFISLAVSVFISNYIFMAIIRLLPFIRRKKLWQGIIISIADISSIITYIGILLTVITSPDTDKLIILEVIGSILGILIGYIAAMMLVLDGISLFKSRRLKEFERGLNNKEGKSIPKNILGLICVAIAVVLLVFVVITLINYDNSVLVTLVGTIAATLLFIGLSIFFFISGKAQHQSIKSNHLLLYIKLPDKSLTYQQELSKDKTLDMVLGKFKDIYMLDEFGMIVTPTTKYVVKGIMVTKLAKDILNELDMQLLDPNPFEEALENFQKYNRKKIILDENNKITKIIDLK